MTEKTIDPIFAPSVLEHAMAMFDDVNFDALKAEPRLEGVVDKNPKTAAIILAGGSGERLVTKVASSSWKVPASPSSPVLPKCSML